MSCSESNFQSNVNANSSEEKYGHIFYTRWNSSHNLGRGQVPKGIARGKVGNPPETEKIAVEKWCYIRRLFFSNKFSKIK